MGLNNWLDWFEDVEPRSFRPGSLGKAKLIITKP